MLGLMCVIDAWFFSLSLSLCCSSVLGRLFSKSSFSCFLTYWLSVSFSTVAVFLPHSLKVSPVPLTSRVIINSGISIFVCPDKFLLPSEELN